MLIGYARVSSSDQSLDLQVEQLEQLGCEKIFKENASGKDSERSQLNAMLDFSRNGDIIHVTNMDRLSRNAINVLRIADQLAAKTVGLICHNLGNIDINSDVGQEIYSNISHFAKVAEIELD